ncbi:hypothetical protein E2C01_094479 [Portunus trituberculatus]|uniref:Uncharacterized protein n=1 Tax=Portunus trituberculatus TaxID=210409 RepID=A0A5B7K3B9_PORTR|nr:hypothetical protein [Portunus trituberculatus]
MDDEDDQIFSYIMSLYVRGHKILKPDSKTPVTDAHRRFYTGLTNELPSVALPNMLSFLRPLKDPAW